MLKPKLGFVLASAAALSAIALFGPASQADVFDSTLSLVNFAGFPGPFGTVEVNLTSTTTATITYTAAPGFVFLDQQCAGRPN